MAAAGLLQNNMKGTLAENYSVVTNGGAPIIYLTMDFQVLIRNMIAALDDFPQDPDLAKRIIKEEHDKSIRYFDRLAEALGLIGEDGEATVSRLRGQYGHFHGLVLSIAGGGSVDKAAAKHRANELYKVFYDLEDVGKARIKEADGRVTGAIVRGSVATLSLILFAAISAMVLAFLLIRGISRPINEAVDVAVRVASGDLTANIDVHCSDETGRLMQTLRYECEPSSDCVASASGN